LIGFFIAEVLFLRNTKIIYDKIDGVYPSDHYPVYAKFKGEMNKV